jgi:hypothetical protein
MKKKACTQPLPDTLGNHTPHFQTMITSTLDPNNYQGCLCVRPSVRHVR